MTVYFVQDTGNGRIKIGTTSGPVEARVARLQTGASSLLRILLTLRGGVAQERTLHREFAPWRVRGEWFAIPDKVWREFHAETVRWPELEDCSEYHQYEDFEIVVRLDRLVALVGLPPGAEAEAFAAHEFRGEEIPTLHREVRRWFLRGVRERIINRAWAHTMQRGWLSLAGRLPVSSQGHAVSELEESWYSERDRRCAYHDSLEREVLTLPAPVPLRPLQLIGGPE